MTEQEHQDRLAAARAFTRPRRLTAAVAFSVGVGSLVYGTVLALPASAATTATPSTAACSTASAAPSYTATTSDSGTATPTATGSDSPTATDTASAGSATPTDAGSPSASPTECATDSSAPSVAPSKPSTPPPGGGGGAPTASAVAATSATPSASKSTTGATAGTGTGKGATPTPSKATTTTAPATLPPPPIVQIPKAEGSYAYAFDYTAAPPGNASYQLPTTSITRAQIITRAEKWLTEKVPYSQVEWWTNANGTYRQDCSGYVSMAWGLNQYTDFWTGNLNLVSHTIPAADLLPGDNLMSNEHTILFAGWANTQHTEFDYYEEAHPGTVARYVVDAPLSAFLDNGFVPFRYNGVVGSSSSVPPNPANGDLYSALALKASEINPPGVDPAEPLGLNGESAPAASSPAASASSSATRLSAQIAADDTVSSEGARSEGAVLGAAGIFLLGAGLLIRRPVPLRGRRGKH